MTAALLAIDPGVRECGYALWGNGEINDKPVPPLATSVIKGLEVGAWNDSLAAMTVTLQRIVRKYKPQVIATEFPELMGGARGRATAGSGDLTQMTAFCGLIQALAISIGAEYLPLTVSEWKGQLKKETVNKRITRAIGDTDLRGNKYRSHAWDAVGVGLVAAGHRLDDVEKFGRLSNG